MVHEKAITHVRLDVMSISRVDQEGVAIHMRKSGSEDRREVPSEACKGYVSSTFDLFLYGRDCAASRWQRRCDCVLALCIGGRCCRKTPQSHLLYY